MSKKDKFIKRIFDFIVALIGLILTWPIILIAWIVASIETKSNGFFFAKKSRGKWKTFYYN